MRRLLLSLILLLLVATNALAITPINVTVGPGKDYSTLLAAVTATGNDLVASDQIVTIDCYAFSDTSAVTINDYTTDSTHTVTIQTPTSERHNGKWDTTAYYLEVLDDSSYVLKIQDDYIYIDGLQIRNTSTSDGGNVKIYDGDVSMSNCILRYSSTATAYNLSLAGDAGASMKIWNNIIYGGYRGIRFDYGEANQTFAIYNNTVYGHSSYGIRVYAAVGNASLYLKNNLCQSNGTDFSVTTFTTRNYLSNLSEDATSPNKGLQSLSVTFVNEGADDFHLTMGSRGVGEGSDLTPDDDSLIEDSTGIDGNPRGCLWDIGADEVANEVCVASQQKPPAGTRIKTGHPSTKDLELYLALNENTGELVWDASENGNNGVISGATWVSGGLNFDGIDDIVSVPDSPGLDGYDDFTLEVEFCLTDNPSNRVLLSKRAGFEDDQAFYWWFKGLDGTLELVIDISGGKAVNCGGSITVPSSGNCYHAAVVRDGTSSYHYFNGSLENVDVCSGTIWNSPEPLLVGAINSTPTFFLPGIIHYIKISSRALSATEIKNNAANPFAPLRHPQSFPFFVVGAPPTGVKGNYYKQLLQRRTQ